MQLLEALDLLHGQGVVHRALRPDSLLWCAALGYVAAVSHTAAVARHGCTIAVYRARLYACTAAGGMINPLRMQARSPSGSASAEMPAWLCTKAVQLN